MAHSKVDQKEKTGRNLASRAIQFEPDVGKALIFLKEQTKTPRHIIKKLTWTKNYVVNISFIDTAHLHIISETVKCLVAMESGAMDVLKLSNLIGGLKLHFYQEINYLREQIWPKVIIDTHIKEHHACLDQMILYSEEFLANEILESKTYMYHFINDLSKHLEEESKIFRKRSH